MGGKHCAFTVSPSYGVETGKGRGHRGGTLEPLSFPSASQSSASYTPCLFEALPGGMCPFRHVLIFSFPWGMLILRVVLVCILSLFYHKLYFFENPFENTTKRRIP